jgi:ParB-like chromosome segregation protein Spo0J
MAAPKKEPKAYLDEQVRHIHESIRELAVDVDTLTPYHKNPRRGDIPLIMESLRTNGQYRPIVVNKGTLTGRPNEIIAGNHTYAAVKSGGWQFIAATWVDVDDAAAARLVVIDNRASDKAKNDADVLASLLGDLDDLEGTGYTDEDLAKLLGHGSSDTLDEVFATRFELVVECDDEGDQAALFERLTDEGLRVRVLSM